MAIGGMKPQQLANIITDVFEYPVEGGFTKRAIWKTFENDSR